MTWISERLPAWPDASEDIFGLLYFLYAYFVYLENSGWVEANTHSQNALIYRVFWIESPLHSNLVHTSYPWTSTSNTPGFNGLPIDKYLLKSKSSSQTLQKWSWLWRPRVTGWSVHWKIVFRASWIVAKLVVKSMACQRRSTIYWMLCWFMLPAYHPPPLPPPIGTVFYNLW